MNHLHSHLLVKGVFHNIGIVFVRREDLLNTCFNDIDSNFTFSSQHWKIQIAKPGGHCEIVASVWQLLNNFLGISKAIPGREELSCVCAGLCCKNDLCSFSPNINDQHRGGQKTCISELKQMRNIEFLEKRYGRHTTYFV